MWQQAPYSVIILHVSVHSRHEFVAGGCSKHEAAGLHAAARAVSGAAVYVSDKPGQHDFAILKKLVLSDGSVLRGLLPGRPTLDCLFLDPLRDNRSLLKVRNPVPIFCGMFFSVHV